jgi:SAM-dependent methyltransferase
MEQLCEARHASTRAPYPWPVSDGYQPAEYWSDRLSDQYDLGGTGHLSYSRGYNEWLYRAKRRALRRVLAAIKAGAAALDLGSGTGWVVHELLTAGMRVDGCDIAEIAVDRLRERFPAATFFQTTLGGDPLPRDDAAYGLVTALDVMYHVTDDAAWERALLETARVLRPGGVLIASDGFGAEDRMPGAHVRFRSLARWSDATAAAGLRQERLDPYFRWLSRDPEDGAVLRRFPDGVRGAMEYVLETIAPRAPHMRLAVFSRQSSERYSSS